jgi:23S rRNA (uracil1939-C5)-methyltransferase
MVELTAIVSCPHGEECGACAFLGESYRDQLDRKRGILGQALGRYDRLRDAQLLPCLPSPHVAGYRNRAKLAVGLSRHARDARVGYFRAGTREIVDAPECRVLVPELADTARRVRGFIGRMRSPPRELRHLDLRCGSDPTRQHLTLVFRATECPTFPLDALRRSCPRVDGFSVNLNPSAGPQVIRGAVTPLWGEREVWVDHAGYRLRVSPAAFFQVNLALLPSIHRQMSEFLADGSVLADLYAGVGTHGLALRKQFRRVLFIEGSRSAAADLKSTIRRHEVDGVDVAATSVERSLGRLRDACPDAVVLNPSRAGADESVLQAIADSPATRIAYLSCDPTTLSRDLDLLQSKKLKTSIVQPIDMMPQTRQVEALAFLRR